MTTIINHLPEVGDIPIPERVYQRLYDLLIEPFEQDIALTKAFWHTYGCVLIYPDTQEALKVITLGSDDTASMAKWCLEYPETKDALPDGYELWLSITNDEGGGAYLLLPPNILEGLNDER